MPESLSWALIRAVSAIAAALPRHRRHRWIVTPDTLLRWHRRRSSRHWTQPHRPPGRPSTISAIRDLIVEMANTNPTGPWTTQAARNLFVRHGERLAAARALVRDRGSQFIERFDEIFRTEGLTILKTPVANAFAERWIATLRRELLDRTIIWNHRRLERLAVDYLDHHNDHRPHRSLNHQPPRPADPHPVTRPSLRVQRTTRCDDLIDEYRNAA